MSTPQPQQFETRDFEVTRVVIEDQRLSPAVYNTETSGTAEMQTYTSQCGISETDQISAGTSQHSIEAILFKDVAAQLWTYYAEGRIVEVDMPSLEITNELRQLITDMTIQQNEQTKRYVRAVDGEQREVFDVQIQLKSPEAVENTSA